MPGGAVRLIRGIVGAVAAAVWTLAGVADARTSDFSDWAVVVVAGDWRGHTGPTQAFDNARKDLSAAFVRAGFRPENVRQYSLRPGKAGDDLAVVVDSPAVLDGLVQTARQARGGCLFYLTSHGSPNGAVFGPDGVLTPAGLDQLLTRACGPRPTVAVISACFSGVFMNGSMRPNRMIITAARADRSSFGCGERNRYPYFDACVLESLPKAANFQDLADRARACVARMEAETGMAPPSEPQVRLGAEAQRVIPNLSFRTSP